MILEILISTIDAGIDKIKAHLLPVRPDVRYLISWQYTGSRPEVPDWIRERTDVTLVQLAGRGLCRNRNHALNHAVGDILKISDDDECWENYMFDSILEVYDQHPEYDIVHFQIEGIGKTYPSSWVSSCEITMRRSSLGTLRFDERFGLGSEYLMGGEEDVFMHDARLRGLNVQYLPYVVCHITGTTTGHQYWNPRLMRSKGAVFYYTRGLGYALYKSARESVGWMMRRRMNPFKTFYNMWCGINYVRSWQQ